jgi:nitroreductase
MDVIEAMARRHSVRRFDSSRKVEEEKVEELLRCACLAPSAGNVQPWRFCVVWNREIREALARAALGQGFVASAPVDIVVCADLNSHASAYGRRGVELYSIQDTAAAIQNILLAATSQGLGTCWVGAFNEEAAARALNLEGNIRPLAIIPVGYPERWGSQPRKIPHRDLTHHYY